MQNDLSQIIVEIPTRGMFGLIQEIQQTLNIEVILESELKGYEGYKGDLDLPKKNFLISCADGKVTAYAMKDLERWGRFYTKPGDMVYEGQILGYSYGQEMVINTVKEKRLVNFRNVNQEE